MSSTPRDRLAAGASQLSLPLGDEQLDALTAYLELLQRWGKVYNLVGDSDAERLVDRHLLDSLAAAAHVVGTQALDMGSGAGLPGLPIAIARPDLDVVLLDANAKRTRFLTSAVAELGLANVTVVRERVESYRPTGLFDTVTARALAPLGELCRMADPLLVRGGVLLALKGQMSGDERDAGVRAGFRISAETETVIAGDGDARYIVRLTRTTDPDPKPPA